MAFVILCWAISLQKMATKIFVWTIKKVAFVLKDEFSVMHEIEEQEEKNKINKKCEWFSI